MIPHLSDRHVAGLRGLLASALDDADREGRTGDWVDMTRETFDALIGHVAARAKVAPVGGEPFGTQVTMWSPNWGIRHAIITSSPKPEGERDFLDSREWGIVLKPDRPGAGGGMTYAPADILTLGWHPEGDPKN